LVTALYPAFGASAGERAELRRLVGRGLSTVMVVVAPMSAALVVCAPAVVQLVYQRGSFGPGDVTATSTAVMWYAPALLALSWREVVTRASYAVGDTTTPVLVAVVAMAVNVIGDLTLGRLFGIPGLAGTTALSIGCAAVLNTWLLRRRHRGVVLRHVVGLVARTGAATVLAALAGLLAVHVLADRVGAGAVGAIWTVAVAGSTIAATFLLSLRVIRAPELDIVAEVLRLVLRRS
jgi:putative peptidoglycan lipid II flippase